MKSNTMVWVVLIILVLGAFALFRKPDTSMTSESTNTSTLASATPIAPSDLATVPLAEQSDLGQSGVATFTENADGKLVVTLTMSGGTFPDPQPAHIHVGSCPNPGAVKYPLTNVVDGMSETILDTTWEALEESGEKLAVNVHKSAAESKVYTACGDLPLTSTMMEESPASSVY